MLTESKTSNETNTGSPNSKFFPVSDGNNIISEAWDVIKTKDTQITKKRAKEILFQIQNILNEFHQLHFNIGYIPKLHAFLPDDDSILIEWVLDDFRLGFTIEPSLDESGWYLVTNEDLGSINAYGYLRDTNLKTILI